MAGRKPKPTALKKLEGNLGKRKRMISGSAPARSPAAGCCEGDADQDQRQLLVHRQSILYKAVFYNKNCRPPHRRFQVKSAHSCEAFSALYAL